MEMDVDTSCRDGENALRAALYVCHEWVELRVWAPRSMAEIMGRMGDSAWRRRLDWLPDAGWHTVDDARNGPEL